jgi:hypothetical protein
MPRQQVYLQLGSRLVPALSSRPVAPHACGRFLGGTEGQVSDTHPVAPSSPSPSPGRPSLGPLMWLSFRLSLSQASCVSPSYGDNSPPLLRTPTSGPRNPPQVGDLGTRPRTPSFLSPRSGDPAPPLGDLESHSLHARGLPQLGVEGTNWMTARERK